MLKKILIGILSFVLILTCGMTAFKLTGNRKFEHDDKEAFWPNEVKEDINYLLDEPLTLTNRIITDDDIENYKEKNTVYIIKSPKRLGIDKNIKKIVLIKTENETIGVFYFRGRQEVRMK